MSVIVVASLAAQIVLVAAPELPGIPQVKVKTQRLDAQGKLQRDQSPPRSPPPAATTPQNAAPFPQVKVKTLHVDPGSTLRIERGKLSPQPSSNPNASPR